MAKLTPEQLALLKEKMETPDRMAEFVTKGKFKRPAHLKLLGEKIAAAVKKGGGRIIVTMPPRHGKSQLCSVWLPTWFLQLHPDRRVILAAYEADFAASWGRKVRDNMEELKWLTNDVELRQDSTAAHRWEIKGHGGGMMTAGVGGPMSGKGADLLIIDDPIKNDVEANSQNQRDALYGWWTSTAFTRLEPNATVIIIHTRWHADDLIGRLLIEDQTDRQWTVINFPALSEGYDVLGRHEGDALWPERYDVKALEKIKKQAGTMTWSALYQQRPMPAGGGIFLSDWFPKENRYTSIMGGVSLGKLVIPRTQMTVFITSDLAVSLKGWADYTVHAVWGLYWHGERPLVFLLNVFRKRVHTTESLKVLEQLILDYNAVDATVEQVAFQLSFVQDAKNKGLPIRAYITEKDKVSRAQAAAPYCENGQIIFPMWAPWLDAIEKEMWSFPKGAHDDFVDTLSIMCERLIKRGIGISGDVDAGFGRARRQEIQDCVAEPNADPIGMDDAPVGWENWSYFLGGDHGSASEEIRDPFRR